MTALSDPIFHLPSRTQVPSGVDNLAPELRARKAVRGFICRTVCLLTFVNAWTL